MCDSDRWPIPPIRPEDLPLIRELLMPEEFERLLRLWDCNNPGDRCFSEGRGRDRASAARNP
jgi:hypothetical protein